MKKYLLILILAAAAAAFFFRDRLGFSGTPKLDAGGLRFDPFEGYRENAGAWQRDPTGSYNSLRKTLADEYGLDLEADKAEVNELWQTALAFHKGYNIAANGWKFMMNEPLQVEFQRFLDQYGTVTPDFVSTGQFV
jgi:hypothetical protein